MGGRELGDPDGTGENVIPEQPFSAGGDSGPEQASGADRRQEGTSAERRPGKTMTREKYSDYVRSQGEPIPDYDRDDDRAPGWESAYAAADRDPAVPEGPPEADIDRWHALYEDYLQENPAGWDQSVNVAGDKPDLSPGDTSDLPPSGPELVTEETRESRAAAFRQEFYQPEVIDGIHDTIEQNAGNVAALFERPPTGSHVEVPATVPQVETQSLEGLNASDLTMAGFVVGVMAFELGRWSHNRWESLRGT